MSRFWKYLSFLTGSLLLPVAAMAAFNDVVVNSDQATITLPGTNKSYNLTRSTRVESFTVNQTSIDFVMLSGSLVEIVSSDRHPFVVSTGCEIIEQTCNSTQSLISVQCTDVSKTITITPTNGSLCDTTGGGSSGSSGGGGGGGRSTTPLTTTPSAPAAARLVVNVTVDRPTPVTVGSSSHTVTVLSASAQTVTVRIASEPVTVTLARGEIKDVDTNGDGKDDLRVRYVGLSAGQPQLEFIELAAAPAVTAAPADSVSCALTKQMAYKKAGSAAVYYITDQCAKRPFNNSRVFFTYFDKWSEVKSAAKEILDGIPNDTLGFMPWGPKFDPQYGALVKIVTDPKTYLLLGTEKYWITSEDVFIKLGYQWNWIEDIDQRLLDKYATGSEINYTNRHPNFTLVKYAGDPKVYRLEANQADATKQVKRHIKDEKAFKALKYRWDRIVTVTDSEQYTDGAQLTN